MRILFLAILLGSGLMLRAQDYPELNLALVQGNYAEVISKGRPLIDRGGAAGKLLELVAIAHEGLEQKDRALECYQKALEISPNSLELQNSVARCYLGLGRVAEAKNTYLKVLEVDSTNFMANNQLAKILYTQREFGNAVTIYGKLIVIDTANYYFYKQAGECFSQLNLNPFAINLFTEAFRLNPRDPGLAVSLAVCHLNGGEATPALEVIHEAQRYDSLNFSLLRYEGFTYFGLKDYEKSDSLFYKLVELGDTTYFTLSHLGFSLMGRNYVYKAIKPLERAYEIDSTDFELLRNLAIAATQVAGPEKGLFYYQKLEDVLRPAPSRLAAVFSGRGDIYRRLRNYDLAYEWFLKAYATENGNLLHLANAGQAMYYKKDYSKAKKCYLEFVETYDRRTRQGHNLSADAQVFSANAVIRNSLKEIETEEFFQGKTPPPAKSGKK